MQIADQKNTTTIGWKFPKKFWLDNLIELCERTAHYGFFIVPTRYLTDVVALQIKKQA